MYMCGVDHGRWSPPSDVVVEAEAVGASLLVNVAEVAERRATQLECALTA